jgi:protein SCO1
VEPRGVLQAVVVAGALSALAAAPSARAEDPWGTPRELSDVGIDPQPNAKLPIDAVLRDEHDGVVRLGDFFHGERPVVLVLAYFKCPMLCGMVLESTVHGLKQLEWTPGKEYELVVVSIDARETSTLARHKKEAVVAALGRPGAEDGLHFLTTSERHVAELTKAVGFKFRFLPDRNDFAHGAGIFICTPDGRVSQTITGLGQPTPAAPGSERAGPMAYDPRTLRLSLVEAGEGKVGTLLDQVLLYCFHYDPKSGKYTAVIMNVVRLAGGLTVLLLGSFVGTLLWRERRQARAAKTPIEQTLGAP